MPNPLPKRVAATRPAYRPTAAERFDEDEVPAAAAALAAITDPVPVHPTDGHRIGHVGRLLWRGAVLVAIVVLVYLPGMLTGTLVDGEEAALGRGPPPLPTWADAYQVPVSMLKYPTSVPRVLALLVRSELHLLGESGGAHHVRGATMHAIVVVLLWLALRRAGRPAAWLAAAAFAAWPGGAAAVEWVGQRGRLWAAMFAVAGVLVLLKSVGVPPRPADAHGEDEAGEDVPVGWRRLVAAVARPVGYTLATALLLMAAWCQPTVAGVGVVGVLLVQGRRPAGPGGWGPLVAPVVIAVLATVGFCRATPAVFRTPFGNDPVANLSAFSRAMWETGRAVRQLWPTAAAELSVPGSAAAVHATVGLGMITWATLVGVVLLRPLVGSAAAVGAAAFALLVPTVVVPPALLVLDPATRPPGSAGADYLLVIPVLVAAADGLMAACRRWVRVDLAQRLTEVGAAAMLVGAAGGTATVRGATFDDTSGVLRTFVTVDGNTWSSRSLLAEHFLRAKQPHEAEDVLLGLTLDRCPDAVTAVAQGDLLRDEGAVEAALPWYARAERLDPSDPAGVVQESAALLSLSRPGDAIDNYLQAIQDHPNSAVVRTAFGNMLLGQQNPALAEQQFRLAVSADPSLVDAHVGLATALLQQSTAVRAAVLSNPAAGVDPATIATAEKQLQEGASQLQEAVKLDPDNATAFHYAGSTLAQLGDFKAAVPMLRHAVQLEPNSAEFRNDLGVGYIQLGHLAQAEGELKESVRLRPDYAAAEQNLTIVRRLIAARKQAADVGGK